MVVYGDTKRKRNTGGSWSQADQDAYDRSVSKSAYDKVVGSGDPVKYLLGLEDAELLRVHSATSRISRYGSTDWQRIKGMLDAGDLTKVKQRLDAAGENERKRSAERWENYEAQRRAKLEEEVAAYQRQAELTAGLIGSDVHAAVARKEEHDQLEGDWLEDPVAAYIGCGGFGEEVRERAGIKLQITVSLDASTSVWANRLQTPAIKAFINLVMAIRELQNEYPDSVYTASFLWAMREDGKWAKQLETMHDYSSLPEDCKLDGGLEWVRSSVDSFSAPSWAGEDTWIHPLFSAIERWENEHSDPGAVRLDLIITDGVLEHPTDIRQASEIQERRDGTLHTVLLNFLPEQVWHDTQLPTRCIQYPADVDNLDGMLRLMLAEYVGVYA